MCRPLDRPDRDLGPYPAQGSGLTLIGCRAATVTSSTNDGDCPGRSAIPERGSTHGEIASINAGVFQSGEQDFLFFSAVRCDGKSRGVTVPIFPNQPGEFGGSGPPALPWSLKNPVVNVSLAACPVSGDCFSEMLTADVQRILSIRDATAAESRGGNNIPGVTVAAPSVVTRQAAGIQVRMPVAYSCEHSLPPPVQFEALLGQVVSHPAGIVSGPSPEMPTTVTGVCNGKSHQLAITESPAANRPWAVGPALLVTDGYFCQSVSSGIVCSGSSAWSPVQVKNPGSQSAGRILSDR